VFVNSLGQVNRLIKSQKYKGKNHIFYFKIKIYFAFYQKMADSCQFRKGKITDNINLIAKNSPKGGK